jgi:branched-chain amino acid transport system permease protein
VTTLIQQIVNGLGVGAQYALWAVGYGLVYQVLRLMHFAHGDTLIFATLVCYALLTIHVPFLIALAVAMLVAALVSVAIEKAIYKPLVAKDQMFLAFVGALGAAYILRNVDTLTWGVNTKVFPYHFTTSAVTVGGIDIPAITILNLAVAIAVIVAFEVFLAKARYGQAIVAVAQDRGAAALMGIRVGTVVALVYALSGAVGVLGSALYVAETHTIQISLGFTITLKAFIAAILGGIGSVRGALTGGLLLGVLEALIQGYISTLLVDAILFAILIAFLLVRPTGIGGRKVMARL